MSQNKQGWDKQRPGIQPGHPQGGQNPQRPQQNPQRGPQIPGQNPQNPHNPRGK